MKITAKDIMSTQFHTLTSHMGVHQAVNHTVVGALAYPDIVGLLYRL